VSVVWAAVIVVCCALTAVILILGFRFYKFGRITIVYVPQINREIHQRMYTHSASK
jgi:hypothetical protein